MTQSVRPVPKEAKMNKAAELQEKTGHEKSSGGKAHEAGPEKKADTKGALHGEPTDKNPLHGAMKELKHQHPIPYHDHGPHHGTSHHVRHEPLHGLKPR
jgi:hypothetical protein